MSFGTERGTTEMCVCPLDSRGYLMIGSEDNWVVKLLEIKSKGCSTNWNLDNMMNVIFKIFKEIFVFLLPLAVVAVQ